MSDDIEDAMRRGDIAALDRTKAVLTDLATDPDMMVFAVEQGAPETVEWMIAHGAPTRITVDDGFPLMYLAVDRATMPGLAADDHAVLRMLIKAGGDLAERGLNDWTPLHLAAAREDLEACRILLDAGADREARTRIDNYATPEEEARKLGKITAANFIRDWTPDAPE